MPRLSKSNKKNMRKYFVSFLKNFENKFIKVTLEPFLEIWDEKSYSYKKIKKSDLFKQRLKINYKNIITNIFLLKTYKYIYNEKENTVSLYFKPDIKDFKNIDHIILFSEIDKFSEKKEFKDEDFINLYVRYLENDVESGPDTWMNGDITYIKENDVEYLLNVKNLKFYIETN